MANLGVSAGFSIYFSGWDSGDGPIFCGRKSPAIFS